MSVFSLRLSHQPASGAWSDKAILSYDSKGATIHIEANKLSSREIQKAARLLESNALTAIALEGDWMSEQQWAFVSSFLSAKSQTKVHFCDNADKADLEKRLAALMFTRELINETPEVMSPEYLANASAEWLSSLAPEHTSTRFIVGDELQQAGWTGIYNVGRGSERPPVMLELDYNPTGNADAPVDAALVGKGITFDSGGYSIKSSQGMLDMKCDMGGAATVVGGLGLAISRGLAKRVKLYLCCAENLISGHAYKLGDILTYKNGLTVEIVNTDAEGRLVLADGLLAASETQAPLIIDAATLTGAAVAAVGNDYNALFTLDDALRQKMLDCAASEHELTWPLPLATWHQEKCPSNFADTANSRAVKGGGAGGASNAAGFLSRFVDRNGQGWAHLDLAAAYNGSATSTMPAGATGQGIRTIARALVDL
ncbi:aminopeptidase PepB [Alteromonas oceanisediminis]|uniref:aminopeptidase PepB n=1 Tax=Alteromonas oceanisediminis TaxID=2836180 RepID=UPI001BD9B7BD|nr:aminopeptidase PepB [Alteromonas oceanisediminis]MBT0587687.1 aminopeptidase PepB [Alteromonas oceanisediminis]